MSFNLDALKIDPVPRSINEFSKAGTKGLNQLVHFARLILCELRSVLDRYELSEAMISCEQGTVKSCKGLCGEMLCFERCFALPCTELCLAPSRYVLSIAT